MNNFIILEASAGSGKTHNLAKRYINLILNFKPGTKKTPVRNILALTFTNKASIEMKERILYYLKKISLKQDVSDLLNDSKISKQDIVLNANAAMEDILENFDNFNVKTIDSFINLIIKSSALQLGFSPNYEILTDHTKYIDFAIDAFLDNALYDNNLKNILDKFFEQFLLDNHSSWDIKKTVTEEFLTLYKKDDSSIFVNDFSEDINYNEMLFKYNNIFYDCITEMSKIKEFNNIQTNTLTGIKKNILPNKNYLLSPKGTSNFFEKEEIPYLKGKDKNSKLDELFIKAKQTLKNFYEIKAKYRYGIYIKMFKYILKEFDKRTKLDSVIFLQDINKKILNIFNKDSHSVITNIYCRLSNYFKDILIDEFQDTNNIQWQTLKLLAEESLSQDGSFFYVGDKKQAIYGFRGGDSKIFDLPLKQFNYPSIKKNLDTNYRSHKAVVEFNNFVFAEQNIENFIENILEQKKLSVDKDEYKYILDTFSGSKQNLSKEKNTKGYIKISNIVYDKNCSETKDEKIKNYLYETLDGLKNRFQYKDITILCRGADEISQISKWLLEKEINIESYETLNIINDSTIKELFSILKFLSNPTDDTAFAGFITSEIFLKETKNEYKTISAFLQENRNKSTIYIYFREQFPQLWQQYIEPFFKSAGFVAVYELTVSLISKFNILKNFPGNSNSILRFLEIINDFEIKEYGLQNFITYYQDFEKNLKDNNFFIKVPTSNAIKIMTIHKAKGLQFNVVIMPFFDIKIKTDNTFYYNNNFYYLTTNSLKYSPDLTKIYNTYFLKNLSDELNVIYVALTRAVYEFYGLIIDDVSIKKDKNNEIKKANISFLIPEDIREKGTKEKYSVNDKKENTENFQIQPTQLNDITEILSDSAVEIYTKNKNEQLLKGLIIHYALASINRFDKNNIENIIEQSLELTQKKYPEQDLIWLKDTLVKFFEKENIINLFSTKGIIYNEKEFVDKFGNTIRPDKIIIEGKNIKIIDFKTSIYDDTAIAKQMEKYSSTLKEIYQNYKIETFVIPVVSR